MHMINLYKHYYMYNKSIINNRINVLISLRFMCCVIRITVSTKGRAQSWENSGKILEICEHDRHLTER